MTSRRLIVGGDFNFIENPSLDKQGGNINAGDVGKNEWHDVSQTGDLIDTFRHLHPTKIETTFKNFTGVSCRLDRFYVTSNLTSSIKNVKFIPSVESDHSIVHLSLELENQGPDIGPGYWKCNVRTLEDPHFVADLENLWLKLSAVQEKDLLWWDECKIRFKNLIINHSSRLKRNKDQELKSLENELKKLQSITPQNDDVKSQIEDVQNQILAFLNKRMEGAKIRAKVKIWLMKKNQINFSFKKLKLVPPRILFQY